MPKLVIVESPAKAKTISRFLGPEYDVQASFGHVRDLPERADEIPPEYKNLKWAKLGVNVEEGYAPLYVVPSDKKRHADNLKRASKGADELLLATDEDREGESISWHIVQLLKPSKKLKVKRIVFHEITPEAIKEALKNPRSVDEDLVKAQETRRILDRLYGYTLSPLLWKKVAPKLSAGRVQSVAVRLTVERERQRIRFRDAEYWNLEATLGTRDGTFKATLNRIGDAKVSSGASFNPETGLLIKKGEVWLRKSEAEDLRDRAEQAKPYIVDRLEKTPGTETPPVPFMTSTLQQEANRKLRMNAKRAMQVAQQLYEGIDIGGERVGLITYMRTDSLTLAERALSEARNVIRKMYGEKFLPEQPKRYKSKAKNAQEAHEAIRPTDLTRLPNDVKEFLEKDQFALYELIWKRTIACQMLPARVERTQVDVGVDVGGKRLNFSASGKRILFPGFLLAYVEGSDDPDLALVDKETLLPELAHGQQLDLKQVTSQGHKTQPPARYTEASLVKKLENEEIGRPSTYASIISTIQDRGYVFKRRNELIPTFVAFAVTQLLEQYFHDYIDLTFTARMENELDEIAEGKRESSRHLGNFYIGDADRPGLLKQVEAESATIPFPTVFIGEEPTSGQPLVVRVGRFGTFLQRGEGGKGNTAPIPDDMAPAELTPEAALALLERQSSGPEPIGKDAATGRSVFFRSGRFGDYLEVEQSDAEKESGSKPKRVNLPQGVKPSELEEVDLQLLVSLPRAVGKHPETNEEIVATVGPYGPYLKCAGETRNLEDWRRAATISLEEALEVLAQPRVMRGRNGAHARTAVKPIKEFGEMEGASGPVRVLSGRFGPYVTDGKVNATLPKSMTPDQISAEEAIELLKAKAGSSPSKKSRFVKKRVATRRR